MLILITLLACFGMLAILTYRSFHMPPATKDELDAAIAGIPALVVTAVSAVVDPIIAKATAAAPAEDFTAELASLANLPAAIAQGITDHLATPPVV